MASDVDALKHRSFAACTPDELAALRRIMARIRLTPPRRRTRRTAAAGRDASPTCAGRSGSRCACTASPRELFFRQRKTQLRPLILILDVSGSMADYSRHLLQFAHSARRAAARVEVFCFGTRLTRITRELAHRRADEALEQAARAVVDWDGGTRIGAVARHVRPGLGAPRAVPGRVVVDLLRRPGPRRSRACWRRRWSGWPGCATGWCG